MSDSRGNDGRFLTKYTNKEIIEDIKRVYLEHGKMSIRIYDKLGKVSRETVKDRFGSWNNAIEMSDIPKNSNRNPNREEIIEDVLSVYNLNDRNISMESYKKLGKYGQYQVCKIFGKWNNVLKECGITLNQDKDLNKDEMIKELKEIEEKFGFVSSNLVTEHSRYHRSSFNKAFNSLEEACLIGNVEFKYLYPIQSVSSEYVINIIEKILGEKAEKEKQFDWLLSDITGRPLRIDAFFLENNLCVEYNGEQHYTDSKFHRDTLARRQHYDKLKHSLVTNYGYKMLVIKYDEPKEEEYIRKKLEGIL